MRVATLVTMLVVPLALAACDSGEDTVETEDMPMAENTREGMPMSGDTPMMESGAEMRMANAEGTVTAIDNEDGTITIDHGPVAAVDWPAMTMTFEADKTLHSEVAVGDEVAFDFQMSDAGARITSISKK